MTGQTMDYLFGSDVAKETDGVVIQYGTTLRVRIARAGGANTDFAKVMEEVRRPYARLIANELLSEELAKDMLHEAYARAVVKEWSGMLTPDGKEIPYSTQNCIDMFKQYPDFFQFVFQESARQANYRRGTRELEAKN